MHQHGWQHYCAYTAGRGIFILCRVHDRVPVFLVAPGAAGAAAPPALAPLLCDAYITTVLLLN